MALIRPMTAGDVPAVTRIYNYYIVHTHVSFDTEAWSEERRMEWFEMSGSSPRHPKLVILDEADEPIGAAWAGKYSLKHGYRLTVETTIVLAHRATGQGHGRPLLTALIAALRSSDVHRAVAVVALPNETSIALHHRLGYRTVGVMIDSGHKFGRFWSTEILELDLT